MKYKTSHSFRKSMKKLYKKNQLFYWQIVEKIKEVSSHPEHYKPLRNKLKGFRRVHVGSFVVIYTLRDNVIVFISLDHHDKAY